MNTRPAPLIGTIAALMPSTRGPRDGAPTAAPEVTYIVPLHHRATAVKPSADRDILPPAKVVTVTPRPGQVIEPAAPPSKGNRHMANRNSPNQDAILKALGKQSPMTRAALFKASGLREQQFSNAIFLLSSAKKIAIGGGRADRQYGVPGTRFDTSAPPPKATKAAAKPAPKKTAKAATKRSTTPSTAAEKPGPFALALAAASARPPQTHGPDDTRAIRTYDGGAIVLQGGFAVAELTAPQFNAVANLIGA